MASSAVSLDYISRIVGYKIKKGNFRTASPNLPMRIAIFGEANEANQVDLDLTPLEITSAKVAGEAYGYGSPIHMITRILRPVGSDGVGGIPVIAYPQAKAVGATQKVLEVEPTGVATGNGTHTLIIAGRTGVDGLFYDLNIEDGDTAAEITQKMEDAVNAVLGSPMIASSDDYAATFTSKWAGLTANGITIEVATNGNDLGITYSVTSTQAGSGTPSVQAALDLFANNWNTIVVNGYGTVSAVMNTLQNFNGIPDPETPTGRYGAITMKPFIAITGSTEDDPSTHTDSRKEDVTIAIAPAPLSAGLHFEAAANVCRMQAVNAENSPHLDIGGQPYPDMPTPDAIGSMGVYINRNSILKKGCSTVDLVAGRYQMQDFVTTYHPVGEEPPQFRYVRNLMLDWNVYYGYYLLELINVVDKVIARDQDTVTASNVIKPKNWKQVLYGYADDLTNRALIVDPDFMKEAITVDLSTVNPDRLETFFRYKRSGTVRVASTDAEAGFNYGNVN
jgi:phage tail sheath gpL-like